MATGAASPPPPQTGYAALALPLLLAAQCGFARDVAPAAAVCRESWWDVDLWAALVRAPSPPPMKSVTDPQWTTPLHSAVAAGGHERVRWLVARGASPQAHDGTGCPPAVNLIPPGTPPAARVPMIHALADVGADLAEEFRPNIADDSFFIIHEAAASHWPVEAIRALLARGADPRRETFGGATALHWAARRFPTRSSDVSAAPVVAALLDGGARVDAWETSQHGFHGTPLLAAVDALDVDACAVLLAAGADPNVAGTVDNAWFSPLTVACEEHNEALLRLLLSHGADPSRLVPVTYETPLASAVNNRCGPTIVKMLLEAGATLVEVPSYRLPLPPNPLLLAAFSGQLDVARLLLDAGAPVNAEGPLPDQLGREYPLHAAVRRADIPMTQLLLERGADPSLQGRSGESPLHIAAALGNAHIVAALLSAGADAT